MTKELSNLKYLDETKELAQAIQVSYLKLGERLSKIKAEQLYLPQHESFAEYLWEIRLSESVASRIIFVYQKLCVEYKIAPETISNIGWSDAYSIGKSTETKEEALALLEETSTMTSTDLRRTIGDKKHPNCKHANVYVLKICRDCGFKEQVFDDK